MVWTVKFDKRAAKEFKSIAAMDKIRILKTLKALEESTDPRQTGKALKGDFAGLWRYRVGDYRLICRIQDTDIEILVLRVGHRKNIYD